MTDLVQARFSAAGLFTPTIPDKKKVRVLGIMFAPSAALASGEQAIINFQRDGNTILACVSGPLNVATALVSAYIGAAGGGVPLLDSTVVVTGVAVYNQNATIWEFSLPDLWWTWSPRIQLAFTGAPVANTGVILYEIADRDEVARARG